MSRAGTLTRLLGAAAAITGLTITGAGGTAGATTGPAMTALDGSTVPFARPAAATGTVAAGTRLSIEIWLRPQVAAAARYATAVSTPGSTQFRHYLSPAAWGARFGAGPAAAGKISAWLRSQGFTGVHAANQRAYVRATGSAGQINRAFRTRLTLYRATAKVSAGPYRLRANNSAISVPKSLARYVLGVTGLSNAAPIDPIVRPTHRLISARSQGTAVKVKEPCSQYYGQHVVSGLPSHLGQSRFPTDVCGYGARQIRSAYGVRSRTAGHGQTVALVELGLTRQMFTTLQDYARAFGLPRPAAGRYTELSLGRGTACGDFFDVEEQLDVEASYDMAPGANQLVVGGDSCNDGDFGLEGLFNADLAVLGGSGQHPLASVASNSWEGFLEEQPPQETGIEHAFLIRAAAEGVGMYYSSGDGSGVDSPSNDPFAIGVGGTTLGIGQARNRLFETGWSTGGFILHKGKWLDFGEIGAAAGGPSLVWREPGYQKGVVPARLAAAPGNRGGAVRSVPDISADADPFTGFAVGLLVFHKHKPPKFRFFDIGGTSLSAPLVAGMVTSAQTGQPRPFGFLDPVLYRLTGTAALHDTLPLTSTSNPLFRQMACGRHDCGVQALVRFDDQLTSMFGYFGQVTLPGYDNMTGTGSPNGPAFIAALRAAG